MTHLHPAGPARLVPPPISVAGRQMAPLIGNSDRLLTALASKRARVAALEAAWVAASEAVAARGGSRAIRIDDRATWDKATWARYLAAAESQEATYKPRIRRLLIEIDSIEHLLAMPKQRAACCPGP